MLLRIMAVFFYFILFFNSNLYAADDELEKAYSSSNIKAALIKLCEKETYEETSKLSIKEISVFCSCQINIQSKVTKEQEWLLQSALNRNEGTSKLDFIKKNNDDLKKCFGPIIIQKISTLGGDTKNYN